MSASSAVDMYDDTLSIFERLICASKMFKRLSSLDRVRYPANPYNTIDIKTVRRVFQHYMVTTPPERFMELSVAYTLIMENLSTFQELVEAEREVFVAKYYEQLYLRKKEAEAKAEEDEQEFYQARFNFELNRIRKEQPMPMEKARELARQTIRYQDRAKDQAHAQAQAHAKHNDTN